MRADPFAGGFRHINGAVALMVGLLSGCAVLGLAIGPVAAVRSAGPSVVSGWKNGPVAVPFSATPAALATLKLPSGRWVAWAKLFVTYNNSTGGANVFCQLRSTGPNGETHRGAVQVAAPTYNPPTKEPLALSVPGRFAELGGSFRVECRASAGGVTAHMIKIMAMRTGTLKRVRIAPRNSVTTYGSGSPTIYYGSSSGSLFVPLGETRTIGRISLPAGAWAIRTSFSAQEHESGGYVDCRLFYNDVERDRFLSETDHSRVMGVMDTAVSSNSSRMARVTCTAENTAGDTTGQTIDNFRITAVKLGSLVRFDRIGPYKYGSGTPLAKFRASGEKSLTVGAWTTLVTIPVEAGNWMVLAKVRVETSDGPVTCQVLMGADYDESALGSWGSLALPFGVVHNFSSSGSVTMRCFASFEASTSAVRVTAFRVGSLKNVAL